MQVQRVKMPVQLVAVLFIMTIAAGIGIGLKEAVAAPTTVRPYKFGFTIDEQQHRFEKRDERGIVMGEFGFITADGIYHVTVYATDEEGKFRILAMKNYPYESPPKTIDMIVTPKKKPPPAIATTTTTTPKPKKVLPKYNFNTQACSGCFLTNSKPTEAPAEDKIENINERGSLAPPDPPAGSNVITGTGSGRELVKKVLPKVLDHMRKVTKQNIAKKLYAATRTLPSTTQLAKTLTPSGTLTSHNTLSTQPRARIATGSKVTQGNGDGSVAKAKLHPTATDTRTTNIHNKHNNNNSLSRYDTHAAKATGNKVSKHTANNSPTGSDGNSKHPAINGNKVKAATTAKAGGEGVNSKAPSSSLPSATPSNAISGQSPKTSTPPATATQTKSNGGGGSGNVGAVGAKSVGGPKGVGPTTAAGDAGDLYRFKYILDYNGHTETGSRNGNKQGNYFAIGDDNIERTIEYIANEFGYQPRIRWRKLDAAELPKSKENTLKDYEFVWFKQA